MLTIEDRPMTSEERAALQALAKSKREGCLGGCFFYFIALVGLPLIAILLVGAVLAVVDLVYRLPNVVEHGCLMLAGVVGLAGGLGALIGSWMEERKHRAKYRQDLANGRVSVLHCTVSGAVETEADEDVGADYFLQVEEKQVLFLRGGFLLNLEEDKESESRIFPNEKIDVVQAPASKTVLSVLCLGEPLPKASVRDQELEEWPEDAYYPLHGEIELLPASLDTLTDDLKQLKVQKREQ